MVKLLVKIVVVIALLVGGAVGIIECGCSLAREECAFLSENLEISFPDDAKDIARICTYKGEVMHEERVENDTCFSTWDTSRLVAALQQDGYTVSLGEPGELILSRNVRYGLFSVEYSATVILVGAYKIDQHARPCFLGIPLQEVSVCAVSSGFVCEDTFPENDDVLPENEELSGL